MKAYVAGKRHEAGDKLSAVGRHRTARIVDRGHVVQMPVRAHATALGNLPRPCGLARLHQLHAALVHLGLQVHRGKQALGTGQRVEQEVAQLRKLVDGHGRLAHKDQVARERAHVGQAVDAEHAARHRNDRVVGIPDHHGHGHHRVGVSLRGATSAAQLLVAHVKTGNVSLLVVKDLDDLLARDHLLDVSVQVAERCLLGGKEALGADTRVARVQHDGRVAHERDNRELPVEDDEHGRGANHLDGRLNHVGKAVVERLGDRIDVVGEEAHDVAIVSKADFAIEPRVNALAVFVGSENQHYQGMLQIKLPNRATRELQHASTPE